MAITVLENNFAIAPLVLWSRQVCVCTGTLSRWSVLFQVVSLLSRLDGSLETPALDGSEQMLQFFLSTLHHVLAHYEHPRTLVGGDFQSSLVPLLPGCDSGCRPSLNVLKWQPLCSSR